MVIAEVAVVEVNVGNCRSGSRGSYWWSCKSDGGGGDWW